jgi:hypothetical protein
MFYPCRQALIDIERRKSPEHLQELAASSNAETNRLAMSIVNSGKVPKGCRSEEIFGVMVRLTHNLERLEGIDARKRIILAYKDEEGEIKPCKDIISYILFYAPCEKMHQFLFST